MEQDTLGLEDGQESLDPAVVLAHIGGDVRLLQELASMFLEDCPKWMAEIRDTLARGDARALKYSAHQLRGSVGNFGTPVAYEKARQLEALARAGDLKCAADIYPVLEQAIQQFQQALHQLVHKPARGVAGQPPQPTLSPGAETRP